MTQLSLFDSAAFVSPAGSIVSAVKPAHSVRPSIAFAPLLPETSAASSGCEVAEDSGTFETTARTESADPTPECRRSLRELAMAIHEGHRSLRRTPETGVSRMGELAQLVLERHDMVARRRKKLAARSYPGQA